MLTVRNARGRFVGSYHFLGSAQSAAIREADEFREEYHIFDQHGERIETIEPAETMNSAERQRVWSKHIQEHSTNPCKYCDDDQRCDVWENLIAAYNEAREIS